MALTVAVPIDESHVEAVHLIWGELDRRFGVRHIQARGVPHLTIVVSTCDRDTLTRAVTEAAGGLAPLTARTSGYGLFVGDEDRELVITATVVRTPELSALHHAVWEAATRAGATVEGHHRPDTWAPHVTLADRDLTPESVGQVMEWLASRAPRSWSIPVDSLMVIARGDEPGPPTLIPLGGTA